MTRFSLVFCAAFVAAAVVLSEPCILHAGNELLPRPVSATAPISEIGSTPLSTKQRSPWVRRNQMHPSREPRKLTPGTYGITPLHWAAAENDREEVESLIAEGADANVRESWWGGETPLHWAAFAGGTRSLRALLASGATVDAIDSAGEPALREALRNDEDDTALLLVIALLTSGADPNLRSQNGSSALHEAIGSENISIVYELLNAGANPNLRNQYGETPLHLAVWYSTSNVIYELRVAGADTGLTAGDFLSTALHHTVTSRRDDSVDKIYALTDDDRLLGQRADPDALDSRGFSALHWASGIVNGASDDADIVRALIVRGASVNLRTPDGETPLTIAINNGFTEVEATLRSFRAVR